MYRDYVPNGLSGQQNKTLLPSHTNYLLANLLIGLLHHIVGYYFDIITRLIIIVKPNRRLLSHYTPLHEIFLD